MKEAFTLAEVLLTLAIIGVVAALTIPAVITKVTQDQYVIALKKAYNTLKSVEREAVQEHGDMKNWSWALDTSDFEKYFKPHFDILKDCGTGTDEGCFANDYPQLFSEVIHVADVNKSGYYRILTSDGISFSYNPLPFNADSESRVAIIMVDINGTKGPDRYGRDMFGFEVFPQLGIKPHCAYRMNAQVATTTYVDTNCLSFGGCCTTKVLSESAMNY